MSDKKISKTEYLDFVEEKFKYCFKEKGYLEEPAANITSQVDPTVDFIGSKISPLKKYLFDEDYDEIGKYIIQDCMKLKALKYLKTDIPQKFGSYYRGMGILAKPELERVVSDTFDYFINPQYLNIPPEEICIKISSKDEDLMSATKNIDPRITRLIDQASIEHYRHQYGMNDENIFGRDFNIGIKNKYTGEFFSCATFVVMEKQSKKLAIDMGISNSALSMCKFGTKSTVSSSRMSDVLEIDSIEKEKFADALIAVSILLKEDITNHQSKHFRKKFRQYLHALYYWNDKFQYNTEELVKFIIKFLNAEYHLNFNPKENEYNKVLTLYKKI